MHMQSTLLSHEGLTLTAPLFHHAQAHGIHAMHTRMCDLLAKDSVSPANDDTYFSTSPQDNKVRVLRRDVGDRARMVLSGRMADVCAALERMSRAEAISAVR